MYIILYDVYPTTSVFLEIRTITKSKWTAFICSLGKRSFTRHHKCWMII